MFLDMLHRGSFDAGEEVVLFDKDKKPVLREGKRVEITLPKADRFPLPKQ
jgi:hypothetical protein